MTHVTHRITAGRNATLVIYSRDLSTGVGIIVPAVDISIVDPRGTTLINRLAVTTQREDGQMVYVWNTAGLRKGTYKITFIVTLNLAGDQSQKEIHVALV
jgi:hypothetical protein